MSTVEVSWGAGAANDRPNAVVLSPCLSKWDDGAFFAPINDYLLLAGYRVNVFDTMSLAAGLSTMGELAVRCADLLRSRGSVDLLVGNALGGSLAQAVMADVRPAQGTLLVSSPTITSGALAAKLAAVIAHAEAGRARDALQLHYSYVLPNCSLHEAPESSDLEAARRIAQGLSMLLDLDLSAEVAAYDGPMRHIVGANSQLVGVEHVRSCANGDVVTIERSGMRPHHDQPKQVIRTVAGFLAGAI